MQYTYVFEDSSLAQGLRRLFPEVAPAIHSIWELLGTTPSPNREEVLEFLPEPLHEKIDPLLNAIRLFRGAMVLSSEDIEYALGSLAPTPRVRGLKGILNAYLEGPGQRDGFARLQEFVESLKSGEKFPFENGQLCFVPAAEPTLFFKELATAATLSPGVQTSILREVWELPWSDPSRKRGLISHGPWNESLKAMARVGVRASKTLQVHFSIQAEPGRVSFLHRYLDHLKFPPRTFEPFSMLAPPQGHTWIAFCDESALNPPVGENWLRPGELEQLHQAGFSLARPSERRHRLDLSLKSLKNRHPSRRWLFSSLPSSEFPSEVKKVELNIRKNRTPVKETSPRAELPLRPLSATQLETYARCPAQYFFSSRLRLQRQDQADRTYPLLYGKAVHRALEQSFKEGSQELQRYFEAALKEIAPTLSESEPLWWILTENFSLMAKRIPPVESRLKEMLGHLTPDAFEKPFEVEVEGLKLRGVIDRIDRSEEGVLLLDYKTGNIDFTPQHISQGVHFQALLYLLAAEKTFDRPCLGLLFYDLKRGEIRRGILLSQKVPPHSKGFMTRGHILSGDKFVELRDAGLEHLRRIACLIREGNFEPRPSAESCGFCDFPALCGKGLGYV